MLSSVFVISQTIGNEVIGNNLFIKIVPKMNPFLLKSDPKIRPKINGKPQNSTPPPKFLYGCVPHCSGKSTEERVFLSVTA